jgi:ASPM-SPD-2-Hydin domain-containing protein/beta-propeller repeat-containing protein
MDVALTREGISIRAIARTGARTKGEEPSALNMQFTFGGRAGRNISWRGEQRVRGESNYFVGRDARLWRTRVPHFAAARATGVIPGVDVIAYGNNEGIEYDLRLAPGTDAGKLRLKILGISQVRKDARGNLLMQLAADGFQLRKPRIYEERESGKRLSVDGQYVLDADGSVGFEVGPHDAKAILVIDPSLSVAYSTFLGGSGDDSANSIALDSSGKVYVGGTTTSVFAGATGVEVGPSGASTELFVAKFDPSASGAKSLIYLTFIGGSLSQAGGEIAIDAKGDVAITGTTTSTDFPVTDASKRTAGTNDVTITELDPTGAKLIFSTLFGGSGAESTQNAGGIALDSSGNVFIATDTTSADLPVTSGAFQSTYGGGISDGFLAIFTPAATPTLKYCTYLGLSAQVGVTGVVVDSTGNAYLAGFTSDPSTTFPATNAFQSTFGGGDFDAFLVKIRPSGTGTADLSYATFLGGENSDQALAIALGTSLPGIVYVTGTTQSQHFPTNGALAAFQTSLNGNSNAFFAVVTQNPAGMTSLEYSSYLGGSESDSGLSVAVAAPNIVYVAGETTSANFPALDNFEPFNGDQDAFVSKLDPTSAGAASLIYSTPLGGTAPPGATSVTQGKTIAADAIGHVYLAGETTAADFPRAGPAGNGFQLTCSSCQASPPVGDAFLVEIAENAAPAGSVSFNVAKLNFGGANVGTASAVPQTGAVVNTGNAPLTISALGITGPNSGDFSFADIGNCTGATLSPTQFCSFEIGFTPSIVGPEEAFVSVTDNAPGNPQALAAVGIGNGSLFVPSPPALNFGSAPAGTTTDALLLEIQNPGNATLHIQNQQLGGANPGAFSFSTSVACLTQVPAGGQCPVNVVFSPIAAGSFSAEIEFTDDSGNVSGSTQIVMLTGTGTTPAPIASIQPAALGFGSEAVGTTSGTQTVTLINNGSAPLSFTSVTIAGTNAADFGIVPGGTAPCQSGTSVALGKSCTVAIDFAPQSGGGKNAILAFTDNAGGSPQSVTLAGTAIAPQVAFAPTSLTFTAPQSVGTTSAAQNVTVTNTGTVTLAINHPFQVTGANSGDFTVRDTCPPSLGTTSPSNTCAIQVTFAPTAPGTRTAAVNVSDNAPGSPQSIPLSGTAVQAAVSILPASLKFGSQSVGTSSTAVPVTITNTGATGSALQITSISLAGTNPGDFSETNNCTANGVTIPAAGTCTMQVTFSPICSTSPAARTATLTVADNAPNSPQSTAISGTAAGQFCMDPPASGATTATVVAGQTATYQLDILSMNSFAGTIAMACAGAPTASTCSVSPSPVPVTANSTSVFQVSVATTANSSMTYPASRLKLGPLAKLLALLAFAGLSSAWVALSRWKGATNNHFVRNRFAHNRFVQASALALLSALALAACGGGGGNSGGGSGTGTPAGTYSLTVTGTVAGASQTIQLTLVVQ